MAFNGWTKLGGQIVGPPSIQVRANRDSDVWCAFARGNDDRVWMHPSGGSWARVDTALRLATGPVVDNHLRADEGPRDIAAATATGETWVKPEGVVKRDVDWRLVGGTALGEPALVARQFVLVRGTDDRLWARRWNGDWSQVDAHWQLTSSPAVAVQDFQDDEGAWRWVMLVAASAIAPGHDQDGIWVKRFMSESETWQEGWFERGGRCKGAPAIAFLPASSLHGQDLPLFVRGLDDYLWSDWNGGGEWRRLNADIKLTSSPSVAFGEANVHIVARGPDGAAFYAVWDGIW